MTSEVEEALLNLVAGLCTSLEDGDAGVLRELFDVGLGDLGSLGLSLVGLVPDDYYGDVGVGMLLDLFQPGVKVHEGLLLKQVEDQDDTICSSVVGISYCSISFLSGRIPNLKFNLFFSVIYAAESLKIKWTDSLTKSTPMVEM